MNGRRRVRVAAAGGCEKRTRGRTIAQMVAVLWCAFVVLSCATAPAPSVVPTPLRVGLSFDYPPFSSGDPASPQGLDVELARAFATSIGRDVIFVRTRWPDLLHDLEAGRFDVALGGVTVRPDRSLAGRFSAPLLESGAVLLVPARSGLRDLAAVERGALRIAVNAGGHLERVARSRFPRATILAVTPNDTVPQALDRGAADAVMTDTIEAPRWQATRPEWQRLGPFTRDRKAALFRADATELARAFDAWLLQCEASDALADWRRTALADAAGERTATPLGALVAALDERLALMPDVARAKRLRGLPVSDPAQEARVITATLREVKDAAAALGRSAPADDAVRTFIAEQMALARSVQEDTVRALVADEAANASSPPAEASPHGEAPDLEHALRPAIARISERVATLLVVLPREIDASEAAAALREGLHRVALDDVRLSRIARSIAACADR